LQGWLGYREDRGRITSVSGEVLIASANNYVIDVLWFTSKRDGTATGAQNEHLPSVQAKTVGLMGLKLYRHLFHIGEFVEGGVMWKVVGAMGDVGSVQRWRSNSGWSLALVMEVEEAAALVEVTSVQVFGMEVLMVEVEVEMAKGDDS
jgi:hypothetical protein